MKTAARIFGLSLLLLPASCSKETEFSFEITIAPDVEVPDGARVYTILTDDYVSFEEAVPENEQAASDDMRHFRFDATDCCQFAPTVELFAFLDLDGNGEYDEGEPIGEDPNNPLELDDGYTSKIEIVAP